MKIKIKIKIKNRIKLIVQEDKKQIKIQKNIKLQKKLVIWLFIQKLFHFQHLKLVLLNLNVMKCLPLVKKRLSNYLNYKWINLLNLHPSFLLVAILMEKFLFYWLFYFILFFIFYFYFFIFIFLFFIFIFLFFIFIFYFLFFISFFSNKNKNKN